MLLVQGTKEGRVEKWPTLKKIAQKKEQQRNRQAGKKQRLMKLLTGDVPVRSMMIVDARLMPVDVWTPAYAVDQFYKKSRFISPPSLIFIAF